ncbi:MAG: glycerophosphodiester phosphodiesterase [Eubacteriales bacterium]|nr:glycerophosphodiester phosphodiesterase [Eubacteriales bacterium]
MGTLVWAHRGASGYAPENTLEAFSLAADMGANGIELDVHESCDGNLIVMHDERVDRTTNGHGRIVDKNLDELKRLSASNGMEQFAGARIPTLPEVYELIKPTDMTVNVEIKCDVVIYWGIWEKLVKLERDMGMQGRILYSSFNHYALVELRKIDPEAKIGLLYANALVDPWLYAKQLNANAIHPHYLAALSCPGLIEGCKKNGVAVHPWTVNDPQAMASCVHAGLEAIITNYPDKGLEYARQ